MKSTLNFELQRMYEVSAKKIESFTFKNIGSIQDQIFQIFKSHSRVRELSCDVKNAINWSVSNNVPINISLMYSIGGQARSRYKIFDYEVNLPKLGDIWSLYFFYILNEKIKQIHKPGINVIFIDEIPSLRALGWTQESIRLKRLLIDAINPGPKFLKIVDMPMFDISSGFNGELSNNQTFAILTSLGGNSISELEAMSSNLYRSKERDWNLIKSIAGKENWRRAEEINSLISAYHEQRRSTNWISDVIYPNQSYINASMISQQGRWCPNIWDLTFPQHGGSLLDWNTDGRFIVKIIPEYELQVLEKEPVIVPIVDFQERVEIPIPYSGNVIFHWV